MKFRSATVDDAPPISSLIRSLSSPFFEAPGGAGAERFLESISAAGIAACVAAPHFRYRVAEADGRLAGVIALRDDVHVHHLFVSEAFQGQGVARQLWDRVRTEAVRASSTRRFTVNARLGAVAVYERFGFCVTGPRVASNGIVFQPMVLGEAGT